MTSPSPFGNLFSDRANVPRATKKAMASIIDSLFVQQAVAATDQQRLQEIKDLVEKIDLLAKAYASNVAKPTKKRVEAQQAYEKSVEAMHLAHKLWMLAEGEMYAFDYSFQSQTRAAESALLEAADPLLAEMLAILAQKEDDARNKILHRYVPTGISRFDGERFKYFNNLEEIEAARSLLKDCMDRCRDMQLRPVSSKDVLTALAEMCALLVDALAPLDLRAPIIRDGEVVNPSRL